MSSFKRNTTSSGGSSQGHVRVNGTKAWVNGQILASTGHKEFDSLLGGGHALGSS